MTLSTKMVHTANITNITTADTFASSFSLNSTPPEIENLFLRHGSQETLNSFKQLSNDKQASHYLHINGQSINNKHDDLDILLNSILPNINMLFLSETWYTSDTIKYTHDKLEGIHAYRDYSKGGGVSIYLPKDTNYVMLPAYTQCCFEYEALAVQISQTICVVLYRPPNRSPSLFLEFLEKLLSFAHTNKNKLIG